MNILAFDTSTEILSVAVSATRDARPVFLETTRDSGLHHTRLLMPLVQRIMEDAGVALAELDLIACMRGPGSFTGLRIGMATAKGLARALAHRREMATPPAVSVPTMEVMARPFAHLRSAVLPVIDARKGRYYCAVFAGGRRLTEDLDLGPADALERLRLLEEGGLVAVSDDHPVQVTGPHADRFLQHLAAGPGPAASTAGISRGAGNVPRFALDPEFRRGHAAALLACARERFSVDGPDAPSQGPVYIRGSDAELSLAD